MLDAFLKHVVDRERLAGGHGGDKLADALHSDVVLLSGGITVGRHRRAALDRDAHDHVPHQFFGCGIFEQVVHLLQPRDLLFLDVCLLQVHVALLLARADAFEDAFQYVHHCTSGKFGGTMNPSWPRIVIT